MPATVAARLGSTSPLPTYTHTCYPQVLALLEPGRAVTIEERSPLHMPAPEQPCAGAEQPPATPAAAEQKAQRGGEQLPGAAFGAGQRQRQWSPLPEGVGVAGVGIHMGLSQELTPVEGPLMGPGVSWAGGRGDGACTTPAQVLCCMHA